jgi:hypothetical protein
VAFLAIGGVMVRMRAVQVEALSGEVLPIEVRVFAGGSGAA